MKYFLLTASLLIFITACGGDIQVEEKEVIPEKKYSRFNENYGKTFNDLNELHYQAAINKGVGPLETRDDTLTYKDKLVKIPNELEVYKVDRLTHSVPFLVPEASALLADICVNFRDSLIE